MSKEFLRRLPLFAGLAEADLDQLCGVTEPVLVPAGDLLLAEGSAGDSMYVVVEGEFEVTQRAAQSRRRAAGHDEVTLARCGPGEVLGEISLLDGSPRTASVRALRDSRLIMIRQDALLRVLAANPSMVLAIVRGVTMRLRNTESLLRQREKMAALGTLAAGLAHELNNPAAAAHRAADHLRARLDAWLRAYDELQAAGLDQAGRSALDVLRAQVRRGTSVALDPLDRSDRECALQDWLEACGVDEAWEHAPALVAAGWDQAALARLTAACAPAPAALVARWLALGTSVDALLDDVADSAGRIARIVAAVKSYAFLDQAPVQDVDVQAGLEDTLVILRHKIGAGIVVARDYDPDLPRIVAYGSELNQVWTNVIDNALDAMAGQGELCLRTTRHDAMVVVEIADTGPGMPAAVQERIFEPFFTTKPPGAGAGLGLHIVYNVVVLRHQGQVQVASQPGATRFRVLLPRGGPR
ncbi:MAG: cyclic nucleotide-binding domain-containing protein [Fimbriimonadaceae bacterium]|nr:cyclic nucleotide-binding domain-containing protein [Fimbriimonadaceae bacterium]